MKLSGDNWSSIKPEERSVLTANRVNVQNQKFKKELALKQRGIEDEMRCDNIIYSKREMVMQNRLSRLAKASDGSCSRLSAPFSSASPENWGGKQRSGSQQGSRGSDSSSARIPSRETNNKHSSRSSSDMFYDPIASWERLHSIEQRKDRHVHFGAKSSQAVDQSIASSSNAATPRRLRQSDTGQRGSRVEFDVDAGTVTNQQHGFSKQGSLSKLQPKSSLRKGCYGFSSDANVSNLTPRNSLKFASGLEEEMARWRRLHHTRVVNARIKAVRSGGKRHASCATLRETMDHAAAQRKQEALNPTPFTAHKAWGLLNCGYLRLTPSNLATLEDICSSAGYDVSSHPHKPAQDTTKEMNDVFQKLRESHRTQPDTTSQLKFRQSLLFKRLSEGFHTQI